MQTRFLAGIGLLSLLVAGRGADAAGTFTFAPVTGDADSGISAAKTYTHAVDFGGPDQRFGVDPGTVVNGVTFHIGGPTGPNYSSTGFTQYWGSPYTTNSVPAGPNTLDDLLADFYHASTLEGTGDETLTLTGLTPGTQYATTFYNAGWDMARTRIATVSASDGGTTTFDQNFSGEANPSVLRYTFTAAEPTITYTFDAANNLASFHQTAFTNEVVPEPTSAAALIAAAGLAALRRRRR